MDQIEKSRLKSLNKEYEVLEDREPRWLLLSIIASGLLVFAISWGVLS